jgi:multicomponent Na+:H+ antiporter subunit G
MSEILGIIALVIGVLFNIFGCIGLVRFPDIYNRLQAATKCVTVGTCFVLLGAMLMAGSTAITAKCIVCALFVLVSSPTAAHALARGAHASGVKLWEKSVTDKFEDDGQPGVESGEHK